jgi:5-oxoprolinase (ATP-hydrolysing)
MSQTPPDHDEWEFWIDVGGTFTDCFARWGDGSLRRHKVLSSGVTKGAAGQASHSTRIVDSARCADPLGFWDGYELRLLDERGEVVDRAAVAAFDPAVGALQLAKPLTSPPSPGQAYELASGEEAPILAIRYLLGLSLREAIPPFVVRLGTTRGTNALITRRGAKTAFVTTRGFGDVLWIGYQNRPKLFELNVRKAEPLFATTVEIDERITFDGQVLSAPQPEKVRRQLAELGGQGIQSLAVCFLHSFDHPQHEQLVGEIAREVGFEEISLSHQVAPLIKIVSRGDTTVMDAYLNPVLRAYVRQLRRALGESRLRIMTSAGGLVDADRFVGKDSILSGPAGGVVGFSRVAEAAGFKKAIGFDMGGTSTDVSRYDGRYELEFETEKAGVRVVAPMMAIETVAAGGGSICRFDGVKLVVGPDSAGADPGPACYGRGGPLAVTDLNFYLGKLPPERFPFPLNRAAVERRLAQVRDEIERGTGKRYELVELCDGLLRVANANMVKPIRSISIAKGYDPRQYVLVAFGGAAGQHACAVARELGMRQVLLHPDAGLLSAYGIGLADVVRHGAQGVYQPYSEAALAALKPMFDQLTEAARAEVLAEGVAADRIEVRRSLDIRYQGLDAFLTIPEPSTNLPAEYAVLGTQPVVSFADAYMQAHQRLYGYVHEDRPLEIVAARVEVVGRTPQHAGERRDVVPRPATPQRTTAAYFDAQPHKAHVYDREHLRPGDAITGPAIICEASSTTVIDPGWRGEVLAGGEVLVTKAVGGESFADCDRTRSAKDSPPTAPDPVLLEIFNNQFAGIAEQMGITLRNTASSVNVKERLDFSCAVFTAEGDLVVNAPHIPVHLGAMSETVKQTIADNPVIRPGDVFVTNDPYRGGSHLPDVTVVTPVHEAASGGRQPPDAPAASGVQEAGGRRQEAGGRSQEAGGRSQEMPRALLFFTASRAHHAEIGGIRPGSMPPFSKNLAEEGVLIRNFKLVDSGQSRMAELRQLLLSAPYPTRAVGDNLADIAAQVAANHQGARDLARLIERYSLPVVQAYMRHIQSAAERKMRMALRKYQENALATAERTSNIERPTSNVEVLKFVDHLDDGSPIAVSITLEGDSATLDFTGTGPVMAGNLNANRAIVTAAVMYCLRCLIDEDIPLNQGVLAPIKIVLPLCLLNPPVRERPEDCAAVVGGNVETSQRVVDVVLGALGIAAASQGTMNNTLFGDATFGYYETICGGAGATAAADGADAVHTHMTNTRLTDPEVIERRYPVRVLEFSIRRGSGGAGRHRGGDGVVRRIEFLRNLEVSLLHTRRGPYPPYGLAGGAPGAIGRNSLKRTDGAISDLSGQAQFVAQTGDVLTIETPGGGGYGKLESSL